MVFLKVQSMPISRYCCKVEYKVTYLSPNSTVKLECIVATAKRLLFLEFTHLHLYYITAMALLP